MFEFFDKVIGFFDVLWIVIENLISTSVTLLGFVIKFAGLPAQMVFYAPSIIVTGMAIFMAIAFLKFAIGR